MGKDKKKLDAGISVYIAIVLFAIVWTTVLFYDVVRSSNEICEYTEKAEATVTGVQLVKDSGQELEAVDRYSFDFIMAYSVDGTEYKVYVEDYKGSVPKEGDILKIYCNPENPNRYVWAEDKTALWLRLADIMCHIFVTMMILIFLKIENFIRK